MTFYTGKNYVRPACEHKNQIADLREGNYICTDCGVVQEQILLFPNNSLPKTRTQIESHILDICERGNITLNIANWAYSHFYKITIKPRKAKQTKKAKYSSGIPMCINKKHIAAFAIYEALIFHKAPRSPLEIAFFSGTNLVTLMKIERELFYSLTNINPVDYVFRFCTELNLNPQYVHTIKSIIINLYGLGNIRPNCIVATIIYLFCKEFNLSPTLEKICEICIVSPTNVHKIIRRIETMSLKHDYVNKISLLASP